MAKNDINNVEQFLAYVNTVIYGGIGMSISEKEDGIRNANISRNLDHLRYGVDSVSLTSKEYNINRIGNIVGSEKIGNNANPHSNENARPNDLDKFGGVAGYDDAQESLPSDERMVNGAMYKDGIVNNRKFQEGASFMNPSSFERYDVNDDSASMYATSSINTPVMTGSVKGAYKYNGGNEDLDGRILTDKTDLHDSHLFYNEDGDGFLGNSPSNTQAQTLNTNDVIDFVKDDSVSSGSLMLGDIEDSIKPKTLAMRTNELFRMGKIGSIVARFKTGKGDGMSSKTAGHGLSRGRNLLKAMDNSVDNKINGYDNPYCRVWTNHYQFSKHSDLIRPFLDGKYDALKRAKIMENLPGMRGNFCDDSSNLSRLDEFSVLEDNGHVTITPYDTDYERDSNGKLKAKNGHIQKYMFSIENLAWKGYTRNLSAEQKGPNGGRIMWFPPYNLKFDDKSSASWEPITFIGRGEDIYTYSKTQRESSVSFDILVDHPSITDAFTYNAEIIEENDQKLLRFFAGCDNLEVAPGTVTITDEVLTSSSGTTREELKPNENTTITEKLIERSTDPVYIFVPIFFPNNFTGVNYLNHETYKEKFVYSGSTDEYDFYAYKHSTQPKSGSRLLVPVKEPYFEGTTIDDALNILSKYEAKTLKFVGEETGLGEINFKAMKVVRADTAKYKKETVTDRGTQNNSTWEQIEGALGPAKELMQTHICETVGDGGRYVHAADVVRYITENIHKDYFDTMTLGLNTSYFSDYVNNKSTLENILTTANVTDEKSKTRVKYAFENGKSVMAGFAKTVNVDESKIKMISLEELLECTSGSSFYSKLGLSENDTHKWNATFVAGLGSASHVGYNNESLANLRLMLIMEALISKGVKATMAEDFLKHYETEADFSRSDGYVYNNGNDKNEVNIINATPVSHPWQKLGRCSCIVLKLEETMNCEDGFVPDETTRVLDKKTKKEKILCKRNIVLTDVESNKSPEEPSNSSATTTSCEYIHTPDKEYQYFKKLKVSDPVLFSKITKKFQYFDPAFHSITPEGFNGRLTFLQQCVRQGPTVSTSNNGTVSAIGAGNLAFGTQPYCVLRIGDFFNTKVIIKNVNITFASSDSINWDLNPEGIGVQPMYAHVDLQMTILGGSDIEAPISRLQNAISSNYYANASVYDTQALKDAKEEIEYKKARNLNNGRMN